MQQISLSIKCGVCREILESPVILPCGDSICRKHTTQNNDQEEILCLSCGQHYKISLSLVFPPNNALDALIKSQIASIDFGQKHRDASHACQQLEELVYNIENNLNDPYNLVYEYISSLKYAVQLKGEEMILRLSEKMGTTWERLEKFSNKCKQDMQNQLFLAKLDEFRLAMESGEKELIKKSQEKMDRFVVDEPTWEKIRRESEVQKGILQARWLKFEKDLFPIGFKSYQDQVELEFELDLRMHFG